MYCLTDFVAVDIITNRDPEGRNVLVLCLINANINLLKHIAEKLKRRPQSAL